MKRSKGQDLIEYLLILYTVSIAVLSLVQFMGISTANLYGNISSTLAQSQIDPANTCNGDTTLGKSCTLGGVSSFYAGTCTPANISDINLGYDYNASNNWVQYYNANGTTNPPANFNGANSSPDNVNCGNGKNLYVASSYAPIDNEQECSSNNGFWNGSWCGFTFQNAVNYCASLGPGWQLPSADEAMSIGHNVGGDMTTGGYWTSTENSANGAYGVVYNSPSGNDGHPFLTAYTNADVMDVYCVQN